MYYNTNTALTTSADKKESLKLKYINIKIYLKIFKYINIYIFKNNILLYINYNNK